MKKGLIWGGFGALLLIGIVSGYAPDLMLARDLAAAREEGLLTLPPARTVAKEDDAKPMYLAARSKHASAAMRLITHFSSEAKTPSSEVLAYLRAVSAGSSRPRCSRLEAANVEMGGYSLTSDLYQAAKFIEVRATDETSLLPAAQIARHLGMQNDILASGYGAILTSRMLDHAAKLNLPVDARQRIVNAIGPLPDPREVLRRHIAETVGLMEMSAQEQGRSASRIRREGDYLRFWRGFFASARQGGGFVKAMEGNDAKIRDAEVRANQYTDPGRLTGRRNEPWSAWGTLIEKANARLAAGR